MRWGQNQLFTMSNSLRSDVARDFFFISQAISMIKTCLILAGITCRHQISWRLAHPVCLLYPALPKNFYENYSVALISNPSLCARITDLQSDGRRQFTTSWCSSTRLLEDHRWPSRRATRCSKGHRLGWNKKQGSCVVILKAARNDSCSKRTDASFSPPSLASTFFLYSFLRVRHVLYNWWD